MPSNSDSKAFKALHLAQGSLGALKALYGATRAFPGFLRNLEVEADADPPWGHRGLTARSDAGEVRIDLTNRLRKQGTVVVFSLYVTPRPAKAEVDEHECCYPEDYPPGYDCPCRKVS